MVRDNKTEKHVQQHDRIKQTEDLDDPLNRDNYEVEFSIANAPYVHITIPSDGSQHLADFAHETIGQDDRYDLARFQTVSIEAKRLSPLLIMVKNTFECIYAFVNPPKFLHMHFAQDRAEAIVREFFGVLAKSNCYMTYNDPTIYIPDIFMLCRTLCTVFGIKI